MQIGEYDSDDGELWDDDDDDDEVNLYDSGPELADSQGSWETESEHSVNDLGTSRDRIGQVNHQHLFTTNLPLDGASKLFGIILYILPGYDQL